MERRTLLVGMAAAACLPSLAWSQASEGPWPGKPVRWVLSQPPGSGPDNVARQIAEPVARRLGQPIVIDNRPGGQNVIGAQLAAHAPADGYTFYFATTAALVTNRFLFKTLPYDPEKDFEPVAFIGRSPFAVLVRGDSPIRSLADLLERSKAANGGFTLANEGPRTFGGIIARLLNARTGMNANLVSYTAVGSSLQDVMGGHTDAIVADVASTAQLARQGRLRIIAVVNRQRVEGWEAVPTLSESMPGFDMGAWLALVAPAGTAAAVVTRMHQEVNRVLAEPDSARRLLAIGPVAEPLASPAQLGSFLREDRERWAAVVREVGILPE